MMRCALAVGGEWIWPSCVAAGLAALLVCGTADAQGQADQDWPCVQRKVGTISAGTVWTGPPLAAAGQWDQDFDTAALAQKLASRRTPIEDIDGLLDAFAERAGAEKAIRMTRVFAGVLELINAERDRVMLGISRYARGQTKLAERVRSESDTVGAARDSPMSDEPTGLQDAESALKWDKRIFEERNRSLRYVCETPVLLEQRVFDIARRIQQRL